MIDLLPYWRAGLVTFPEEQKRPVIAKKSTYRPSLAERRRLGVCERCGMARDAIGRLCATHREEARAYAARTYRERYLREKMAGRDY